MSQLQHIKSLYYDCWNDCLQIAAGADTAERRRILINRRIGQLAEFLGKKFDLDSMSREHETVRIQKYEEFLRREYNVSRQDANKMMVDAMEDFQIEKMKSFRQRLRG